MKNFLGFLATLVLLASCKSAYGEEMDLIAIPIIFAVISLYGLFRGIQLSKSGTKYYDNETGKYVYSNEKFPFFHMQNVGTILFIGFGLLAIITYFYMRGGN